MIGYEELVSALASWRARQGLAETGSDFLGPRQPFPEYRVPHPSETRDYAEDGGQSELEGGYESELDAPYPDHEGEVLYADEGETTEFGETYAEGEEDLADAEAAAEAELVALADEPALDAHEDESAEAIVAGEADEAAAPGEIVGGDPAESALGDYAIDESYEASMHGDEERDGQAEHVAHDDIEAEYAVDVDDIQAEVIDAGEGNVPADEMLAAESSPDAYEAHTQLSDPEALYAEGEATSVGSVDDLAAPPAAADDLDDAIDNVDIGDSDSVSYGDDADPERNE